MLSKIFNRGAPAPAADIRAAQTQIDLPALEAALTHAEAAYRAALLEDDEAALARADAARDRARRDLDRGQARREELAARLSEAESAERKAAARQRVADVTARRDAAVARWNADVAKAHKLLAPLADELAAVESEVDQLNSALYSGRDEDLAEALGAGVKGVRATLFGRYFSSGGYGVSRLIALPPTKTTAPIGWFAEEPTESSPRVGG